MNPLRLTEGGWTRAEPVTHAGAHRVRNGGCSRRRFVVSIDRLGGLRVSAAGPRGRSLVGSAWSMGFNWPRWAAEPTRDEVAAAGEQLARRMGWPNGR